MNKRKKPASSSRIAKARPVKGRRTRPVATIADRDRSPVVGIGASAGGLEALKAFFCAVPAKTGLVFVVIAGP